MIKLPNQGTQDWPQNVFFLQLNILNAILAVMDTYKLELFVQAFAYVICLTSRSVMAYSNRRLFLTNSNCIVSNYGTAKSIFANLFIQTNDFCFLQKRKTVRARKRTRRMPNKNPLNQKPLAKLSRIHLQNSPKTHLTTHIIGMSYSSYIPHINLPHLSQSSQTQAVQYFLHLSPPPAVPTTPHTLKKQDF